MSGIVESPTFAHGATGVGPEFFYPDLPLPQLQPSPLNPRKHFHEDRLRELAASFASVGIIEPLVARVVGDHYEIVCGDRRWRAAGIAGLATVPVMVKVLSDTQALEIMVVENQQREDVDALDEAEGFKALLATGYGIDKLAERIGLSKKYVYDRLKLLQLVPAAQQILTDGRITAGHAILLARLSPQDQAKALAPYDDGLFAHSDFDEFTPTKTDPYHGLRVLSVREFDAWIEDNIRIDLAKPVEQDQFPEIAKAQETAERVVSITRHYHIDQDGAKGKAARDRVLTAREWKRADGTKGLDVSVGREVTFRACATSVLGVVVIGPDRGAAFKVCVDQGCDIHWKKERAERTASPASAQSSAAGQKRRDAQERKWKEQHDRENAERDAYRKGAPAIFAAFVARVKTAKAAMLADAVTSSIAIHPKVLVALPKPKTAEDVLRLVALTFVAEVLYDDYAVALRLPAWAKRLGVDLKPLLKAAAAPVQTSAQKPKSTAKKKR